MRRFAVAVGWIVIACCGASAQAAPEAEKAAATELSGRMLECSVYFRIAAVCMHGVPDTRVPDTIRYLDDSATRIGALAVSVGATAGVTAAAQQEAATSLHGQLMGAIFGSCHNIAILLHRYHNSCVGLLDHATTGRRTEAAADMKAQ